MKIRILITGGTIDKSYDIVDGTLQMFDTHISEMLEQARSKVEVEVEKVLMKVSTKLTEEDIQLIINQVRNANEDRFIITHGTDTMVNTAERIASNSIDKTIVFTGATIPYIMEKTDSMFNLGCAMTAAQLLPYGVYITMNGQIFPWDKVKKDKPSGYFKLGDEG